MVLCQVAGYQCPKLVSNLVSIFEKRGHTAGAAALGGVLLPTYLRIPAELKDDLVRMISS